MLLDTISNTFGGIFFVTMLLALLTQTSSVRESFEGSQARRMKYERKRDELQRDVDSLSQALANMRRNGQSNTAEMEGVARRAADITMSLGNLEADLERSTKESALLDEKIQKLMETVAALRAASRLEEEVLREALAEIDDTIKARRQADVDEVYLPRLGQTAMSKSFLVLLRYGRLYRVFSPPGSGQLNLRDLLLVSDAEERLRLAQKPTGGTPISSAEDARTAASDLLAGQSPSSLYVTVAVWSDSYEAYSNFRGALVEKGFRYRCMAIGEGNGVVFGRVKADIRVQ